MSIRDASGTRYDVRKLTAPSHWASYLINGDASGMERDDLDACCRWLNRINMGFPVDCTDAGFKPRYHDAWNEVPLGTDCQEYVFHCKLTKWTLRRVYLNGDYDRNGYYYGAGLPLYEAQRVDGSGDTVMLRAATRDKAKSIIRRDYDCGAVFFS